MFCKLALVPLMVTVVGPEIAIREHHVSPPVMLNVTELPEKVALVLHVMSGVYGVS